MHISDLDYVQSLAQNSTILGGEASIDEILKAKFRARINALQEDADSAFEELTTRKTNASGASSARNRANGGSFSRTAVSVFQPDISTVIIDAEVPES